MPRLIFEPTIPEFQREKKFRAIDRAINVTGQGRTPKKYTGRRVLHNYYTHIKHQKTFYKHLIFNFLYLIF
jgi:hypothetical protein